MLIHVGRLREMAGEGLWDSLESLGQVLPNHLYFGVLATTAFFALIVVIFVVYFAIRYRDDAGDQLGAPVAGWMPLELGWSLIPFFISISILAWAAIVLFHTQNTSPK